MGHDAFPDAVVSDPATAPRSVFDQVAEALLIALIVYLPLHFGGVLAFSQLVFVVVAGLLALLLLLRTLLVKSAGFVWSWSYVPVGLVLGLVALQLVPLPVELLRVISPETVRIKADLLGDPPGPSGVTDWLRISFYPHATWTDLRLLLALATVHVAVLNVYRTVARTTRLLVAVAVAGGVVALLGIAQVVTGAEGIFWSIGSPGAVRAGSFVVHSHYCQFLNLTIGAALGVLLLRLRARAASGELTLPELVEELRWRPGRADLALAGCIVTAMVAIALSRSRNGVLSLVVAVTFTLFMLARMRFLRGVGWPIFGLLLVAFAALLGFGSDSVVERMATLGDPQEAYAVRGALLRDTVRAAMHFPALGLGQGAHELAFPMFDESLRRGTAAHAENQYAEVLEEIGVTGLLAGIAFLGLLAVSFVRTLRSRGTASALAFGLGFGVVATLWHAWSDFGMRIPAVALLLTVTAALLFALPGVDRVPARAPRRIGGAALASLLAIGLGLSATRADRARRAEWHWRWVEALESDLAATADPGAQREIRAELQKHADRAAELQPGNIEFRFRSIAIRWRGGEAEQGDTERRQTARATIAALLRARRVAPTYGPLWSLAGQLERRVVGGGGDGARWIRRGFRLYPHHPMTCFAAARLELEVEDEDAALAALVRATALGTPWQRVIDTLIVGFARPALALRYAGQDMHRLSYLAGRLAPLDLRAAKQVRERTLHRMSALEDRSDAPPDMLRVLGEHYAARADWQRAAASYRRCLERDYASPVRLGLARALAELGRLDEAITEVRRLRNVRPELEAARSLEAELLLRARESAGK